MNAISIRDIVNGLTFVNKNIFLPLSTFFLNADLVNRFTFVYNNIILPLSACFGNADFELVSNLFSKMYLFFLFIVWLSLQLMSQAANSMFLAVINIVWMVTKYLLLILVEFFVECLPCVLFGIFLFLKNAFSVSKTLLSLVTERLENIYLAAQIIEQGENIDIHDPKKRIFFEENDKTILENAFQLNHTEKHLDKELLKHLCDQTSLTTTQITKWWYKRRL